MVDKKINSSSIWTIAIIVIILGFSAYILLKDNDSPQMTQELATCIGQKSELYIQTGCPACQRQEELFGEYLNKINIVDCFLTENRNLCISKGIEATPTWIIGEEKYEGVRSIETIKDLTNC